MPMKATTVRFADDLWELLEREATREGVSAAQFVRDATLLRIGALAGRRGDREALTSVRQLADTAPRQRRRGVLDDPERLSELARTGLLDAAPDPELDRITRMVRRILNVPVALISLIDAQRQFFSSQAGLGEPWATRRETPLSHSFCAHAVETGANLVVTDAREDPQLADNPAISELGVIAYAGTPLRLGGPYPVGSLCAIDHTPRIWTAEQIELLEDLGRLTAGELRRRATSRRP